MRPTDKDLISAIAYSLWKSPHKRADFSKLDNCRTIAADVLKHLDRSAYEISKRETPEFGAAHIAQGARTP